MYCDKPRRHYVEIHHHQPSSCLHCVAYKMGSGNHVSINHGSSLAIGCSTTGTGTVTIASRSSNDRLVSVALGVAMNSQPTSSAMVVGSASTVKVQLLLTNSATVSATATRGLAVAAAGGILLNGDGASVMSTTSTTTAVDVWVGLQSGCSLLVGASANNGVVLGLVSKGFVGFNKQNTELTLCRDNEANPPSLTGGGGVAMDTSPNINGVSVQQVEGWRLHSNEGAESSPQHRLCTDRADPLCNRCSIFLFPT